MVRDAFRARALVTPFLALVLALAAVPSAHAHGEHGFEQGKLVGDLFVNFGLETVLPMANTPTQVVVTVSPLKAGEDTGVEDVSITLFDPSNESVTLEPFATRGTFVANASFPVDGGWRANVTLHPVNASLEFTFPVYAEGPYVWESPNAATALFAVGTEGKVDFLITEWRSQDRAPAPGDVTVRLEHWTDDHSEKLGEVILPTEPAAPGHVVLTHTFNASGMYHAYLASPTLGLDYDDRPYVHVYALSCEEVQEYDPEHACATANGFGTPAPGALAGLAGVLATALVLARRERR